MKRLKVLFCILIFWFSVSILHSVPVDAELGVPSSGNWETVFEQAFSLNSFDQWQNFISENYIQMRTLWEEKMDAEISETVSSVTESDVVHSTDVYKDYILKYLQAQKDSILRDWETNSEQQISEERNTFLGKLSGVYVSRSDAAIPGAGQDYFSQMQIWGSEFQDTLNLGLSEFQNALSRIEQSYSELLEKLQKTDEEIAENEYRIRAYEGMVWDNVKGLVGNMAAQLISNTLLHEKDAQGISLVTLRTDLPTGDENISELLSMDKITIQNHYSQKFICTDINSLESCTTTMTVNAGMCQGPNVQTVKITEVESIVRPEYDDGFSRFFQSSEITEPTVTSWSGGTDVFGNGIGTPVQSERNYILHYNKYQTYKDRLNRPGELMYEFISKMYSELQKPPEERSLTAAAEAVSKYLTEQKIETDKMAAFWQSKVYTDLNLANDSTYRFVYNTGKEKDYFRQSFVKDIELLYRLQENQKKLDSFVSGTVTLAYGFSEQNIDTVRANMPGIYDGSAQPLYWDSVWMPYLRADYQKTYSISEKDTAILENSTAVQDVMKRVKSSLKGLHPTDNIEINYIDPLMNLHASSANLFSDWYVSGHDKVGGNLRTDGLNYRRYRTNFLIDGFAETGGLDYRQDSEENIWVEIQYRIKDKNAEANYLQWANFQTDVNSQTVLWGSQLNSLQNWTVQSANFRNRAALWNQEKANLQNEIQNNYNKSTEELMNEKTSWLSDMDSVRLKAVSGNFSTEIPAIPLLSYEKNISELKAKAESFQNMPNPDFSSFERFASVLDDTMNGFLNLLTADSITDAAVSTSSSALNSMASMLSSQKTMVEAYEVIPEKRKEYDEAAKKFSEGGMCAGEGFEKNRQICEGIYNGPFFKRQYAGVEVKDGQIEVTVMEKTGRVFLKEGGDSKDQDDYIQETVKKTYYINTPGEAKIADMSSLGGLFKGSWSSKTEGWQNSEKKEFGSDLAEYWQYWTDAPRETSEETAAPSPVQEERETLLSSVYREVSRNSGAYMGHFYTNSGTAQNPSYTYNKDSIFSKLMNSMTSRESANSLHFSNLARTNAQNEASKAETFESLAMAVVTGGLSRNNLSSWLKDRMTQAVKGKWAQTLADAMCPGDSKKAKEPCQASEIAMAMLQAKSDKQERKNAEYKMRQGAWGRSALGIPQPGFADLMHGMSKIPILKEIEKPMTMLNMNINAETARAMNKVSPQIVTKDGIKHIQGKDLQASLNAGKTDPKAQAKQFMQEQLYDYVVNLMDPNASPAKRKGLKNALKYRDNVIQSRANDKKGERQRQELAAQVAVTVALSIIPGGQAAAASMINGMVSALSKIPVISQLVQGVQTVAQAVAWLGDKLASFGSYLSEGLVNLLKPIMSFPQVSANTTQFAAVMKNYAIASNLTSTAFAASDGNSEGVLAGLVNGALMGFTGPMGLGGSVSYTPPEKPNFLTDSLSGTLDHALNGSAPSGWGGNIHAGNSIFNGGITFAPGSGTSIDLGFSNGGQGNQTWFGNLSYNVDSGHTSVSAGMGHEYGTNLSVSASTDKDEKPSMTLNFGCDMKGETAGTGNNCGGGGANEFGLGGSLTIREGGGMDIGFDFLGNQYANASFDTESGEWGNPQFNSNWGNEVIIMNHQDMADEQTKLKKMLDDIASRNPENAEAIRRKLEAGADSPFYDPETMIHTLMETYPKADKIDFYVKQMNSDEGKSADARARETVEKIKAADPKLAETITAKLDEARRKTETEGVRYDPGTVLQTAMDPKGRTPEEAERLRKADAVLKSEDGILDRFSAGVAAVLSALGISTLGLGLLNRTGSASGAGSGSGSSPSPDPQAPIPDKARRREEGDGGEGGTADDGRDLQGVPEGYGDSFTSASTPEDLNRLLDKANSDKSLDADDKADFKNAVNELKIQMFQESLNKAGNTAETEELIKKIKQDKSLSNEDKIFINDSRPVIRSADGVITFEDLNLDNVLQRGDSLSKTYVTAESEQIISKLAELAKSGTAKDYEKYVTDLRADMAEGGLLPKEIDRIIGYARDKYEIMKTNPAAAIEARLAAGADPVKLKEEYAGLLNDPLALNKLSPADYERLSGLLNGSVFPESYNLEKPVSLNQLKNFADSLADGKPLEAKKILEALEKGKYDLTQISNMKILLEKYNTPQGKSEADSFRKKLASETAPVAAKYDGAADSLPASAENLESSASVKDYTNWEYEDKISLLSMKEDLKSDAETKLEQNSERLKDNIEDIKSLKETMIYADPSQKAEMQKEIAKLESQNKDLQKSIKDLENFVSTSSAQITALEKDLKAQENTLKIEAVLFDSARQNMSESDRESFDALMSLREDKNLSAESKLQKEILEKKFSETMSRINEDAAKVNALLNSGRGSEVGTYLADPAQFRKNEENAMNSERKKYTDMAVQNAKDEALFLKDASQENRDEYSRRKEALTAGGILKSASILETALSGRAESLKKDYLSNDSNSIDLTKLQAAYDRLKLKEDEKISKLEAKRGASPDQMFSVSPDGKVEISKEFKDLAKGILKNDDLVKLQTEYDKNLKLLKGDSNTALSAALIQVYQNPERILSERLGQTIDSRQKAITDGLPAKKDLVKKEFDAALSAFKQVLKDMDPVKLKQEAVKNATQDMEEIQKRIFADKELDALKKRMDDNKSKLNDKLNILHEKISYGDPYQSAEIASLQNEVDALRRQSVELETSKKILDEFLGTKGVQVEQFTPEFIAQMNADRLLLASLYEYGGKSIQGEKKEALIKLFEKYTGAIYSKERIDSIKPDPYTAEKLKKMDLSKLDPKYNARMDIAALKGKVLLTTDLLSTPMFHMYSTKEAVKVLTGGIQSFTSKNPGSIVGVNDISMIGKLPSISNPVHHEAGSNMDLGAVSKNGQIATSTNDPNYDRAKTGELIRAMIDSGTQNGKSVVIWFNDLELAKQINAEYKDKLGYPPIQPQWKSGALDGSHHTHIHVNVVDKGTAKSGGWLDEINNKY